MIVSVTLSDSREDEISDAIKSVVDQVDRVLLIDTGIRDRTLERARAVAAKKLSVIQHKWVDFAKARNAGIDAAEQLGAKWIVIVDSDERINFGSVDLRGVLSRAKADVFRVASDDGFYVKEKIVRAHSGAHYVGPTHEALIGGAAVTLRGVTFHELPKTEPQLKFKFARDVELLTEFIEQHPEDPRWHYYLGQSLEGLGDRLRAVEEYARCARLRKTGDEAAWAAYKQAEQLFILDRFEESIEAAAMGFGANATFAECAWIAAIAAHKLGRNDQAVAWARTAEAVGRHKGCGGERAWFQHLPALYELPYDVLRFALPNESSRAEAEVEYHDAKLARIRATERVETRDLDLISVSRTVSAASRTEARSMLYPPRLSAACPSAERTVRIQFEPPGGRLPMNPSICAHQGELRCVIRAVNYTMKGRVYEVHDPKNVVRTENYLGRLDLSGRFIDPRPVLDLDPAPRHPSRIVGYEDIRLVSIKERGRQVLTGSATVCDRDPAGRRLIARLHFDAKGNVKRAAVQQTNQPHEKNWMPVPVAGGLAWIYSVDPTAILPGPLHKCSLALDHLRGGAAIPFRGGYLCVTHETFELSGGRIYLHRFVRMDQHFVVTAVSPAWVFAHHGVEFCAGLVHWRDELLLSYGVEDCEAWLMRVSVREVEKMRWITP